MNRVCRKVGLCVTWGLVGLAAMLFDSTVQAADGSSCDDPLTLLAFGDSLTAGYGLPQDKAFPVQLEQALRAEGYCVAVTNAGVSGDTSAAARGRFEWAWAAWPAGQGAPDAAIVALGGNDGLRGLEPARMEKNLDAIVAAMQKQGTKVLLAGMLAPPNLGKAYGEAFAAVFPSVAQKHDIPLYPFFLEGVAGNPALNLRDGIHPTAEGVAVMVKGILPQVRALLDAVAEGA